MDSICSWRASIMSSCLTQPLRDKGGVIFSCFSIQKDPTENDQLLFMMESPTMTSCITEPLRSGDAKTGLSGAGTGFSAWLRTPYVVVFIDLFLPMSMFLM